MGKTKLHSLWAPGSLPVGDLRGREVINWPSSMGVKNERSYNAASNRRLHNVDKGIFVF